MRVVESAGFAGPPESRSAIVPGGAEVDDAIAGLVQLGWTKTQARGRVVRARERLAEKSQESVDVAELLAEALRG